LRKAANLGLQGLDVCRRGGSRSRRLRQGRTRQAAQQSRERRRAQPPSPQIPSIAAHRLRLRFVDPAVFRRLAERRNPKALRARAEILLI
jgi:hypothetical protein